jgi:hypothetical protein
MQENCRGLFIAAAGTPFDTQLPPSDRHIRALLITFMVNNRLACMQRINCATSLKRHAVCNVRSRCVRVAIVALEKHHVLHILSVCL